MAKPKPQPGLPSRQQILDFITSTDTPAGKREIARAFGLHGADKIALKALLKDMADEGLIDSAPGRAFHRMGGVPKVTVLRVVDVDDGGNVRSEEHTSELQSLMRSSYAVFCLKKKTKDIKHKLKD